MKRDLSENIVKQCPLIYRGRGHGVRKNLMCFGFDCESGWYELILNLSIELERLTRALKDDEGVELDGLPIVIQVKEKYGGLRFYMSPLTDEMRRLISKAEDDSLQICEICGAKGRLIEVNGRYYMTCCEEHQIAGRPFKEVELDDWE